MQIRRLRLKWAASVSRWELPEKLTRHFFPKRCCTCCKCWCGEWLRRDAGLLVICLETFSSSHVLKVKITQIQIPNLICSSGSWLEDLGPPAWSLLWKAWQIWSWFFFLSRPLISALSFKVCTLLSLSPALGPLFSSDSSQRMEWLVWGREVRQRLQKPAEPCNYYPVVLQPVHSSDRSTGLQTDW